MQGRVHMSEYFKEYLHFKTKKTCPKNKLKIQNKVFRV